MTVVLWICAAVLAVIYLGTGVMKLVRSKEQLAAMGLGWTEDFSPGVVKLLGALELLAVIGLILPALLHIAPILGPLAATGLALMMIGATVVHLRRKETRMAWGTLSLVALAAFVAIAGFVSPW